MATKVKSTLTSAPCKAHNGTAPIATVSGGIWHLTNFGACEYVSAALLAIDPTLADAIAEAVALHVPAAARRSPAEAAAAALARIRASRSAPVAAVAAEPVYVRNADGSFSPKA